MRYLLFACLFVFNPVVFAQKDPPFPKIDPAGIIIARDSLGTPHIFAKTDAEVAYGLAWANAEDAFEETQTLIYTSKGFMGRVQSIEGAKADFFVHAIGARKLVNERYDKDLTPEYKKYLNGFVQGLNAYAAAHPKEVKNRKAFPVTEKDILTSYVAIMSFLTGVQDAVGDVVGGKYDSVGVDFDFKRPPYGSNAYAMNGNKSADGKTYLCINPHMEMDGGLSFYECQLESEQGLNMIGNMFQGQASNAMGTNKHLGWSFTWNTFDQVDVFKLQMDPAHKLQYIFDGKSMKLEKRRVWLKVNWHGIVVPVPKMTYTSVYGTTLKSDKSDNFYSIRFPANMNIKVGQQLYQMAKSTNMNEFMDAFRNNHALVLFNLVYADEKENIAYISQGTLPDRKHQEYNWAGLLPGNTSKTLWTDLVPFDSMPHVINPPCGFVFNSNNDVYDATCEGQNDNPHRLPDYMNMRPGNNNRSLTLKEFFRSHDRVSFDDFVKIKFESHMALNSPLILSLGPLWKLDKNKYQDITNYISLLQDWDKNTDTNSTGLTAFACFINQIWNKRGYDDAQFVSGFSITEQEVVQAIRDAQQFMLSNFGAIEVKWGTVHMLRRGDKSYPYSSFADMLSPSYPKPHTFNGKLEFNPDYGDTYTMFVRYGKNGAEFVESLQPLGNSLNPQSPHYTDQMEMFLAHRMKHQTFDKDYWLHHSESLYRPSLK
jgi:acyl-homoserine-lactone acylase